VFLAPVVAGPLLPGADDPKTPEVIADQRAEFHGRCAHGEARKSSKTHSAGPARSDALARSLGISRAALIERGLKHLLAEAR
jgi:hypothetical protein